MTLPSRHRIAQANRDAAAALQATAQGPAQQAAAAPQAATQRAATAPQQGPAPESSTREPSKKRPRNH